MLASLKLVRLKTLTFFNEFLFEFDELSSKVNCLKISVSNQNTFNSVRIFCWFLGFLKYLKEKKQTKFMYGVN